MSVLVRIRGSGLEVNNWVELGWVHGCYRTSQPYPALLILPPFTLTKQFRVWVDAYHLINKYGEFALAFWVHLCNLLFLEPLKKVYKYQSTLNAKPGLWLTQRPK